MRHRNFKDTGSSYFFEFTNKEIHENLDNFHKRTMYLQDYVYFSQTIRAMPVFKPIGVNSGWP